MVTKSAAFEKAITESRKLKAKPTQDELLEVRFFSFFFFGGGFLRLGRRWMGRGFFWGGNRGWDIWAGADMFADIYIALRPLQARMPRPTFRREEQTGGVSVSGMDFPSSHHLSFPFYLIFFPFPIPPIAFVRLT